jgi:hypothetical protein
MTGPVTVTKADREAAKAFADLWWLDGYTIDAALASAFARHRLAAEERGARMALEAAAKVFEAEADTWVQTPLRGAMKRKGATAIRQIDPAALGAE